MTASVLRVIAVRDGVGVGEVANVCVVIWREEVTRPRFEAQLAGLREVVRGHPRGAGYLCVVEAGSKPPGDELRRASASMIQEVEDTLRGIACVVEGTGFVGAVARSALSAMALIVGPRKVPLSIQASVPAATAWLAPKVGVHSPAELAAEVEALRSRLPALSGPG